MKYRKEDYVGKKVNLYPNDTYRKEAIIKNVDDLGWQFEITYCASSYSGTSEYKSGQVLFISHSQELSFVFID